MSAARRTAPLRTAVALAATAACGAAAAQVSFQNAWLRAPAPGQAATAGYCEIANTAAAPATIVGFEDASCRGSNGNGRNSGCAITVEMHETTEQDGMVRMRPLPQLVVPAKGALSLAPGGKHLMVFGLASDARQARLRVVFADGAEQVVRFVVRPLGHGG